MLKFHTKGKEVILKDNTVDLIENGFTETYNKIIFMDNLAVSEKVITFLCGPYIVTIKGKFDENVQKLTRYAFYGSVEDAELWVTAKIIEYWVKEK